MCSSLFESVIITEFHTTEPYSSLDLTKVKYTINKLFLVENENVTMYFINITAPAKRTVC
jgi:hypothetical protein